MKIAVAGTGYVGLSISCLIAQHHTVCAVDLIKSKVDSINNRKSPIQDEYIEKYLAEKDLDLTATLDGETAYRDEEWLSLIQECRLSGLTDKQWCEAHQICPSNFYYQIQKFRKRVCEIPESQSKTTLTAQKQGIQCLSPAKKVRSFCGKAKRCMTTCTLPALLWAPTPTTRTW